MNSFPWLSMLQCLVLKKKQCYPQHCLCLSYRDPHNTVSVLVLVKLIKDINEIFEKKTHFVPPLSETRKENPFENCLYLKLHP